MKKLSLIAVLPQIEADLNTSIKRIAQVIRKFYKNELAMPFIEITGVSRFSSKVKIALVENRQAKLFYANYSDPEIVDKINKLRSILIEKQLTEQEISQIRSLYAYLTDIIKSAGFTQYSVTRKSIRDNGSIKIPVFVRLSITDDSPSLRRKQIFKVSREVYNMLAEKARYLNLDVDTMIATYFEVCMSERNAILVEAKQGGMDMKYSDFRAKDLERESFVKVENLIKLIDHFTY